MTLRPIILLIVLMIPAQNSAAQESRREIGPAVRSGLEFLAQQQLAEGSFEPRGRKLMTTGISLLAFLYAGSTADGGEHAAVVRRATEYLLRQTPGDRYFGRVDGSRMHGQAIVTLALCEAYGTEPDEQTRVRLRATLKDAAAILIAAQNIPKAPEHEGGWGEDRGATECDIAISYWCRDALLAAQRIGMSIPQANLDRAGAFLSRLKPATKPAATQPVRFASDLRYFSARSDHSTRDSAIMQAIRSQLPDGGWSAESSESSSRVYSTAQAILMLTLPMRRQP